MFWENPIIQEALRTIAIALLVALLGLLGYDAKIAKPRHESISKQVNIYLQDDGEADEEDVIRFRNQQQ